MSVTKRKTRVGLVLDTSGSMSGISRQMAKAVTSMLDTIQGEDTDTEVVITTFSSHVSVGPVQNVRDVHRSNDYGASGGTALFDAIGKTAEALGGKHPDKSVNYLLLAFTDGEENSSFSYNATKIKDLITEKEKAGNWTIAVQLPKGNRDNFHRAYGIALENLREWEANYEGVQQVQQVTQHAISNYFALTRSGERSSKSFYSMTTDLSGLSDKDVQDKLTNLKGQYLKLEVPKETDIRPFVESKTKKPYTKGCAYYQLTKPEKVQPKKQILIMEKGKSNIYGGAQARSLIGLPTDGSTYAKVEPGNHAKWDIFVQSTSVNRKLVRGTALLVKN